MEEMEQRMLLLDEMEAEKAFLGREMKQKEAEFETKLAQQAEEHEEQMRAFHEEFTNVR